MKKTGIYIVIGVIVLFFVLSLLKEMGIVPIENKRLLLLLSVFAPITKWIADKFNSPGDKIKELRLQFETEMQEEETWQADLATKVADHDTKITAYRAEISTIDTRLSYIEKQKAQLEEDWSNLSEEELEKALKNRFNK